MADWTKQFGDHSSRICAVLVLLFCPSPYFELYFSTLCLGFTRVMELRHDCGEIYINPIAVFILSHHPLRCMRMHHCVFFCVWQEASNHTHITTTTSLGISRIIAFPHLAGNIADRFFMIACLGAARPFADSTPHGAPPNRNKYIVFVLLPLFLRRFVYISICT